MTIQPQTIEAARRAYREACVAFTDIDTKLIDATERKTRLEAEHAEAQRRLVETRDHLVKLHADEQPAVAVTAAVTDLLNAPKLAPMGAGVPA